jgi:uncharacterized membrane protein YraQ (UPF0718 family)
MADSFQIGFTLFLSLLVEALPFLLIGVLFSSVLLIFIDEAKLVSILPRNPALGALAGSALGFLFPVCECGNVPVARRLLVQGIPAPVAVGFLLAAPTINPVVIWATWTAFRDRPELVVLRVLCSLAIATVAGWTFSAQKDMRPLLNPALARSMLRAREMSGIERATMERKGGGSPLLSGTYWLGQSSAQPVEGSLQTLQALATERPALPNGKRSIDWGQKLPLFLDNVVRELRELGGVLVIGSAIAAFIQVAVPREAIVSLGQGPVTSILAMMLLAATISICSTVDSFFALSFAGTFTSGSLLAFLIFGPTIDLKAVGLMLSIFKARTVAYLFVIAGLMSFLFALIVNYQVGW